jgi:hypothetical protein
MPVQHFYPVSFCLGIHSSPPLRYHLARQFFSSRAGTHVNLNDGFTGDVLLRMLRAQRFQGVNTSTRRIYWSLGQFTIA